MEFHHSPLSNGWFLISILGLIFVYPIWSIAESWGFLMLVFFLIIFIASFVSGTRAPLLEPFIQKLAVHEEHRGKRYPDTHLHHGMIPKKKYHMHRSKRMKKK